MITQTTNLNLIPYGPPIVIHCDQYDEGTGRLIFNLYENDIAYSPTGTAVIQGTKPDNHGFTYNATLVGNVVTANLTQQMTAVAGSVRCQIVVTESSGRTGSFAFILEVQTSALPDDTVLSDSDFQLIQQAIQDSAQAVIDAEDSAEDAEAWAVGERNGVPVTSGDPTYENNAKYWSNYSGTLTHLSDVTISAPQDDQVLTYDANSAQWVNAAAGGVPALSSLPDVNITTVSDGQALRYDSNSGKWINEAVADDITDLSDVTISAPTDGQALVYDSNDQEWKNETITVTTTLGNLTDVSLSSVQDGQGLVYDSNSTSWKNKKIVDADAVHWEDNSILGAKNLLLNNATSKTANGGTFTVNTDGSVTVTTANSFSANSFLNMGFFELKKGSYILSQGVATGDNGCRIQLADEGTNVVAYITSGNATQIGFTLNEDKVVEGVIRVPSGWNTSTITFYPMLRLATDTDDTYQPYSMTNQELTEEVSSITNTAFTNATVAPNTITSLGSFTLKKGKYIVTAIASMSKQTNDFDISISFSSSATAMGGGRYDTFNGKAPLAAEGGIQATKMYDVSSDTTVYVVVEHNHSNSLALYPAVSIAKV